MKHCQTGRLCCYTFYPPLFFLLLLAGFPVLGQETQHTFQGRVLSAPDNEPLPGASVQIRTLRQGAITDANGDFTYTVSGSSVALRVSFIGYRSLDTLISLPLRKELLLFLELDEAMLDEVKVSTGYWETSKRLSTGNISKITAETIEKQPVTNVLQALQGRMPGVFVQTENGLPGGNVKIMVRGQSSISAGTQPLYVVDGVPFNGTPLNSLNGDFQNINGLVSPLNSISPSDIESIEVLKDADATAIYGSRGANGVVLIRTKKARPGKATFTVNLDQAFSQATRLPKLLGLADYLALRKEAFANDNRTPTNSNAPDLLVWDQATDTDWGRELLGRTGKVTALQAWMNAGTNTTSFRLGLNYHREKTLLPGQAGYRRGGANLDLTHRSPGGRLSTGLTAGYTADDNQLIKSPIYAGLSLAPNFPIYNQDGTFNWALNNPVALLGQKSRSRSQNLNAHWNINFQVMDGLSLKTSVGYNRLSMNMFSSLPASSQNPAFAPVSSANFGDNASTTLLVEPIAEYQKRIGKAQVSFQTGGTWQNTLTEGWSVRATDFVDESLLENLGAAGSIPFKNNNHSQYRYASFFARSAVDYAQKYLFSVSFRRDGSSRFGPGRQFGNFGSAAMAWIVSEEKWLKKAFPAVSFAKLRTSYGTTGNDQIKEYQYLSTYSFSGVYEDIAALGPYAIANDLFGWESTRKWEAAAELKFFDNRLGLEAAFYHHSSGNQLVQLPISYVNGPFGSYRANFPGVVHNKGWELALDAKPVAGSRFSWTTSLNLTLQTNRLASFPGIETSSYASIYEVGKDLSLIRGYVFNGINPETGIAGFKDINGDGKITFTDDRVGIGKQNPDLFGGYLNTFTWGPLQLDIFFQFVKQQTKINGLRLFTPGGLGNVSPYGLSRWQQAGHITDVQRAAAVVGTEAWSARTLLNGSDAVIANGSYVRGKNISLTYTLSGAGLKKIGLASLALYIRGQNLFLLTFDKRLDGADPENIAVGNLPPLKTLSMGTKISF